jgi:hypothetical protein
MSRNQDRQRLFEKPHLNLDEHPSTADGMAGCGDPASPDDLPHPRYSTGVIDA